MSRFIGATRQVQCIGMLSSSSLLPLLSSWDISGSSESLDISPEEVTAAVVGCRLTLAERIDGEMVRWHALECLAGQELATQSVVNSAFSSLSRGFSGAGDDGRLSDKKTKKVSVSVSTKAQV